MDCLWSISRWCCFQCGIWQQRRWGFSAFVQGKKERSGRGSCRLPFFCSHQRPWHGRHKHHCSVESLGEMCGSLGGWPTFFLLPSLVCWRELRVALLSTRLVTLSLLTAGAGLLQVTAKWSMCAGCCENVLYYACMCLLSTDALQKCVLESMLNSFSLTRRTAALTLVVMCMWGRCIETNWHYRCKCWISFYRQLCAMSQPWQRNILALRSPKLYTFSSVQFG